MKKTLLALAILAAAGSTANAAEIYSSDASAVNLKGEIDAYLANYDIDGNKTDADINTWGKIQVDADTKLNDSYKLAGSFEIESGSWYDGTDNNASFDDMYIALKADKWGIAIGETGDFADSDNAVEKTDITNEGNAMGINFHPTESKGHGLAYKATLTDGLTLVADVNTQKDNNIDDIYGVSLDYYKGIYSIAASYIAGEVEENTDFAQAAVSASIETNGFFVALTYSNFDGRNYWGLLNSDAYFSGNAYELAASYTVNDVRLYGSYGIADLDEYTVSDADADGDATGWVLGVDYAVISDLTVFFEYQYGDTSNDFSGGADKDADVALLGAYYTF